MIHGLLGVATATGTGTASLTALTMAAGDSLTLFNGKGIPRIKFLAGFAESSTAAREGMIRIRSPDMHDSAIGIQTALYAATTAALRSGCTVFKHPDNLKLATVLTAEGIGGSAAGESAAYVIGVQYDPIMGDIAGGNLDLIAREISTAGGAIDTPAYSATVAVANLKANRDYALLGATTQSSTAGAVRFQPPSFNGLQPVSPLNGTVGLNEAIRGTDINNFFQESGIFPIGDVPRFNSNDGLNVQTVNAGAAATILVYTILATQGTT